MENDMILIFTTPSVGDDDSVGLPSLPEETITEILLRLPVKSLLKFRCVSKSWLFLISSYDFAKAQLRTWTKNNVYLHDRLIFGPFAFGPAWPPKDLYTCSLRSVEDSVSSGSISPTSDANLIFSEITVFYETLIDNENLIVYENLIVDRVWFDCPLPEECSYNLFLVGSCNGLVCLTMTGNIIILWNPTTRKSKALPDSRMDLEFPHYGHSYGFGCDEMHDDYKVVEVFSVSLEPGVYETCVKVYSLRDGTWKIFPNRFSGQPVGGPGKFLNGAIHWSVLGFFRPEMSIMVSHDLATDTFVEVPLPNFDVYGDVKVVKVEISILGGFLASCICCELDAYMDVWLMKEYGMRESWTKVLRIPCFLGNRFDEFVEPTVLFLYLDNKVLVNYKRTVYVRSKDSTNLSVYARGG